MVKPSFYEIDADHPGKLVLMPKPSPEWLDDDIQFLRSIGVDILVSMLEDDEIRELGLDAEPQICEIHGIEFLSCPVPDRGLPEKGPFKGLIDEISKALVEEKTIAVHCRAGIGRSGMVVSAALANQIGSMEAAISIVNRDRGIEVPDTKSQRNFLLDFN